MFGDDIFVAPIVFPRNEYHYMSEKSFWIPEGHWIDASSGLIFMGNQFINKTYDLSEIPVFIKSGTILPKNNIDPN